jgi:hypothetical protein
MHILCRIVHFTAAFLNFVFAYGAAILAQNEQRCDPVAAGKGSRTKSLTLNKTAPATGRPPATRRGGGGGPPPPGSTPLTAVRVASYCFL